MRGLSAFPDLLELSSAAVGGEVLGASDAFFAGPEALLQPGRAAFDPDAYTDRGKEMDGWESRRRRTPGHDWCIVRLGAPGLLRAVDIDTDHFLGNHAPYASLDACEADPDTPAEALLDWTPLLRQVPLRAGSQNLFTLCGERPYSHVRLHMHPDGGIARLRVYGWPVHVPSEGPIDLASATRGGRALGCSDMFFSPMSNLLLPRPPAHMGEGWESRRRRGGGHDWVIVQLGTLGRVDRVTVDTAHFKGNFPHRVSVDGLVWPEAPPGALARSDGWQPVIAQTRLGPDGAHDLPTDDPGPWTHLRLNVIPCGGVARLRAWGEPSGPPVLDDPLLSWLNGLPGAQAREAMLRCCGSARWADAMIDGSQIWSRAHLHGRAEELWWWLSEADWREAFAHHPRIGAKQIRDRWASGEQAGVAGASEATLAALAEGNAAYEAKFGHVFLVCATGLTADEMLARLRVRLDNDPADELRVAAGEQAKITRIRLDKLEPT